MPQVDESKEIREAAERSAKVMKQVARKLREVGLDADAELLDSSVRDLSPHIIEGMDDTQPITITPKAV